MSMQDTRRKGRKDHRVISHRDRSTDYTSTRTTSRAVMSHPETHTSAQLEELGVKSRTPGGVNEPGHYDYLETQFRALHQQISQSFGGLPQQMEIIVRKELEAAQISRSSIPTAGQTVSIKQYDALNYQLEELTAKNRSLLELKEAQETKIANLNLDLGKKNRETRKLHEIIIGSAHDKSVLADDVVIKDFNDIYHDIMRIVTRHFAASGAETASRQYNNLKPDDQSLYLRSKIADEMFNQLFQPAAMLFGLDALREEHQVELEKKLRERNVSEVDIIEWRIQTVKVAQLMSLKKRLYRPDRLSDSLCDQLKETRKATTEDAWEQAKYSMDTLCQKAFELALKLRGSKYQFEWNQAADAAVCPSSDYDSTGPFNVHNSQTRPRPVKVLFGAVYKIVDGDHILLRKGEILIGDD